ncbi:hypothetical protein HYS03_00255 [Candidatus Woesebacteria bacterium]|nr:hypothetical protein [Candidatus Woesebacteria bacterium]QQG47390.1 MAG: hypothetical protein HY044_04675 [Candidatus Woesebacteria bacterium]
MRQSKLFPKTRKEAPSDAESINHKLLVRAGFIDQLMAGSWTLLPLGLRVVTKINNIIREEMNAIGGQEMQMPLLHPKNIWNETGRWETARDVMYQFKDAHDREFALSFTHEEIVMDILRKNIKSYQDLPVYVYQFSTKFRNELRAKSGILRGREFMMKDLYSAHVSEEDLMDYYEKVKGAYCKIFKRLGFNFKVTKASGGVFTDKFTHEFQVLTDAGEDTIYWKEEESEAINEEVFEGNKSEYKSAKSIEVGNIFPLGKHYAEKMNVTFVDKNGERKAVWFGSYGIGPTRVMGTLVEVNHDERGIMWPAVVAPFDVHILNIGENKEIKKKTETFYEKLQKENIEVLWDDRDLSAGEKFGDSDLIGIPVRLVVSEKTGEKVEWKERISNKTELLSLEEILKRLRGESK